jgi:hypothetical protein
MSFKSTIGIILLVLFSYVVTGQTRNPYEIIRTLEKQMNVKYPIVDSLYPFAVEKFNGKDWSILTNKEKRKLKRTVKSEKGIKLNKDSLPDRILIPSLPIFAAFTNFDSTGSKLIEQYQPFYMLSNPVFFANSTKAIIALSLIKGFGYTYVFEKRNNDWVIIKSIYRWM